MKKVQVPPLAGGSFEAHLMHLQGKDQGRTCLNCQKMPEIPIHKGVAALCFGEQPFLGNPAKTLYIKPIRRKTII